MKHIILSFLTIAGLAGSATAQEITIGGQVRERTEIDNRSFVAGASVDAYHLLRSRLSASFRVDDHLSATLELQDARMFGSGATNNTGSPALDLRQGYIDIQRIAGMPLALRIGRQSRAWANERLIGRGDWTNTGQSLDAVVARIGTAETSLDIIGAAMARRSNVPAYSRDHILAGGWGTLGALVPGTSLQAFYLYDNPERDTVRQYRHTTGIYARGAYSGIDFELEGAYQFGDWKRGAEAVQSRSIAASMIGVKVGYTLPALDSLRFGVGFDRISGNDPARPAELGAFSTLYGTHHRFYGNMDYLVNVPVATRGLGLRQMIGQLSMTPAAGVKLSAAVHLFDLDIDPRVADPSLPSTTSKSIGQELDLAASWQASKTLNVSGGFSIFDGDRDRYILPGRKTTRWGFVMISAGF